MIGISASTTIYLRSGYTDLRKSFIGLAEIVEGELDRSILNGELFIFCNKSKKLLKAIYWDGSGLCVLAKRLEAGTYSWPLTKDKAKEITYAELTMLVEGLDFMASQHRLWYRRRPDERQKIV